MDRHALAFLPFERGCGAGGVHPGSGALLPWSFFGWFWTTFRATGREDAPVRANQKTCLTEFSSGPNGRLGGPNGAFPSRSLADGFWILDFPAPRPGHGTGRKPAAQAYRYWERPGLGAGIPRPPADPPKNHLYFSNRARPSPSKSSTFLKTSSKLFRDIFDELLNIFATMF